MKKVKLYNGVEMPNLEELMGSGTIILNNCA